MLYDHTVGRMASVCGRYVSNEEDARDVLQDAYLEVFSRIADFEYRGEGSLRAWMTRVVTTKAIDLLRRQQQLNELFVTDDLPDVPDVLPDEADIAGVPLDVIYKMIRRLPVGYRTVFNLFVFERLSHREIAAQLGIRENSSASQFHRAKTLLTEWVRAYKSNHNLPQ